MSIGVGRSLITHVSLFSKDCISHCIASRHISSFTRHISSFTVLEYVKCLGSACIAVRNILCHGEKLLQFK